MANDIRIGMIGLDTSHVVAFTKVLNDPEHEQHVPGGRVVAAFKGGTDVEASASRVDGFTEQLQEMGIEIVPDIPTLCGQIDAVLLESVDGRPHLEQVRPVFAAGKPVFIDKPLTASLADAREILRLSEESGVPFFSASSYRFAPDIIGARGGNDEIGQLLGCDTVGPASEMEYHPPYFFYGIHCVEALYAVMGRGCQWAQTTGSENTDVVVGQWEDGRIGTFRAVRAKGVKGQVTIVGEKRTITAESAGYAPMLVAIVEFFRTGVPPVEPEETLEIIQFLTAAGLSRERGGEQVTLSDLP
ncbi:MAG: Gfo/Idh/MocA family oxidoreductase [Armatimonadota bacterium]|jgi:predicted dehydrogenase